MMYVVKTLCKETGADKMISDDELNAFRVSGEQVRVVRDSLESNDVIGIVVAWDNEKVMIRKRSRRVVQLSRSHVYVSAAVERPSII